MNKVVSFVGFFAAIAPVIAVTTPFEHFSAMQNTAIIKSGSHQTSNRYIVTFKENNGIKTTTSSINHSGLFSKNGFSTANATSLIQHHGGNVRHQLQSIAAIAAELTPVQLKQLELDPQVARIEADPKRFAQTTGAPYGISMVQADQVSDATTSNQKICIIDTGYDINHEDLMNGANVTGEVSNTLTATVDLADWTIDSYGHGTHIAGTISALNNAVGTEGVSPNGLLNLHIVKVIHRANYWEYWGSDVIAAVERCQAAGATVINMSMAGSQSSTAEEAAIDAAYNSGTLFVAAAGNRGNNAYYYPASYDSVISVGAVDEAGDAWVYTQSNDQIELAAPGVGIESTLPNNRYGKMDGSSVATPYVSGVAALVWSHHPECSNRQIRDILQQTAVDKGISGRDDVYGYGLVQAKVAVDLIDAGGCEGVVVQALSCQAILGSGGSTGDGVYTIDADGNGPIAPFEVYCDMTTQGGGWTLIANHKDGLEVVKESPVVTPDNYAVMNKSSWSTVKNTVRFGAMFIDENKKVSMLTKHGFILHSCQYFAAHSDLTKLNKYGHWVGNSIVYPVGGTSFFYNDNHPSGYGPKRCVSIDDHTTAALLMIKDSSDPGNISYKTKGASLISGFIDGKSNFALWPYRGIYSQNEQNELLYFVK